MTMNMLALTGSLRAQSINTEVLRACAALAPAGTTVAVYDGLGTLPHFNPDLDEEGMQLPSSVAELRTRIGAADILLISCPEYAHGPAGSFKNLLDWMVSAPEMHGKLACILSTSEHAQFAPVALVETLRTMSVSIVTGAAVLIPVNGRRMRAADIVADPQLATLLQTLMLSATEERGRVQSDTAR
jgi:chromate reductase, NAD(P)H dehydrogenase (quinone)